MAGGLRTDEALLGEPEKAAVEIGHPSNWRIAAAAFMGDRQTANGFERIGRRIHARPLFSSFDITSTM